MFFYDKNVPRTVRVTSFLENDKMNMQEIHFTLIIPGTEQTPAKKAVCVLKITFLRFSTQLPFHFLEGKDFTSSPHSLMSELRSHTQEGPFCP